MKKRTPKKVPPGLPWLKNADAEEPMPPKKQPPKKPKKK